MHARPASQIAKLADKAMSDVWLSANDNKVDATSIIDILTLGAIKGTNISIVEIRLADDIGGKGLVIYNGKMEEVEEAIAISKEKLNNPQTLLNASIIPNLHTEMAKQLDTTSIFMKNKLTKLEDGEI